MYVKLMPLRHPLFPGQTVLDNLEIRQALLREVEACLALVQDRMLADLNTSAWRTANPDQIIARMMTCLNQRGWRAP